MRNVQAAARDDGRALRDVDGSAPVSGELDRGNSGRRDLGYCPASELVTRRLAGAVVSFAVLGSPAPKGSSRAFFNRKTQRAQLAPSGSAVNERKLKSWSAAVRDAALWVIGGGAAIAAPRFVMQPLQVQLTFYMQRPSAHWGSGKNAGEVKASAPSWPMTKPDFDKLTRTTLDAMTGLVYDDDARIAQSVIVKAWASPGREGAFIVVGALA